jgi:hypothetical protein
VALDVHAEDLAGCLGRVFNRLGDLDATGLATATDLDLRLDDDNTTAAGADRRCRGAGFLNGLGDDAGQHRDTVGFEHVTALGTRKDPRPILIFDVREHPQRILVRGTNLTKPSQRWNRPRAGLVRLPTGELRSSDGGLPMRQLTRGICCAAAVLAMAACGSQSAPTGSGSPPSQPTVFPVTITRTGGIAGFQDVVVVANDGQVSVTRKGQQRQCRLTPDAVERLRTAASQIPWARITQASTQPAFPDDW